MNRFTLIECEVGEKSTVPELDGSSKVDGLLKKSGRSWGKVDGFSTENGRFVKKWAVLGLRVK